MLLIRERDPGLYKAVQQTLEAELTEAREKLAALDAEECKQASHTYRKQVLRRRIWALTGALYYDLNLDQLYDIKERFARLGRIPPATYNLSILNA